MFTGNLSQWDKERHYLPEVFDMAIGFLSDYRDSLPDVGKYPIDGDALYVSVQKTMTNPAYDNRFELHHQYIDIQVLLSGKERQDYSTIYPPCAPTEDRLLENDVAFYPEPSTVQSLFLTTGQYVIYFPNELHSPNLAFGLPDTIYKAVFKVRADLV